MNGLKNNWRSVLLGSLLTLVLLGLGGRSADVSAQATGRRQLIIPAAHFYPVDNTVQYENAGASLVSKDTGPIKFLAPVQFVVPYYATVEKLELMAFDNTNAGRIRVWLYKTKPAIWSQDDMASIDTGVR